MAEDSSERKRGLPDILDGLNKLLELASKIQDSGEEGVSRSGEFKTESGVKGRYGVQIKSAPGKDPGVPDFEVDRDEIDEQPRERKKSESARELEPFVDLLEQEDQLTIVAEIPGVEESSVHFDLDGKKLQITASGRDRQYVKRLTLPYKVLPEPSNRSYVNGIYSAVFQRDSEE